MPSSKPSSTMIRGPELTAVLLRKTRLCSFWQRGMCTRGNSCTFAHGSADVATAPDFSYTQWCKMFLHTGTCKQGASCKFAHALTNLRPWEHTVNDQVSDAPAKPPPPPPPRYQPDQAAFQQPPVAAPAEAAPEVVPAPPAAIEAPDAGDEPVMRTRWRRRGGRDIRRLQGSESPLEMEADDTAAEPKAVQALCDSSPTASTFGGESMSDWASTCDTGECANESPVGTDGSSRGGLWRRVAGEQTLPEVPAHAAHELHQLEVTVVNTFLHFGPGQSPEEKQVARRARSAPPAGVQELAA